MTPIAKDSSIIVIYCDAQEDIPNGFISLSETYYYDIYIYIYNMYVNNSVDRQALLESLAKLFSAYLVIK